MYTEEGKIDAVSGVIDQTTGSVSMRAVFPNKQLVLRLSLIHISYLYMWTSQPWKTSENIYKIIDKMYNTRIDGLCGNDDCCLLYTSNYKI